MVDRLCKNCRHMRFHHSRWGSMPYCGRPVDDERSPVDGTYLHPLNADLPGERKTGRTFFGKRERCGADGQFWEERQPPRMTLPAPPRPTR